MHLSSAKCCYNFLLYFMFLKLLAQSSIVVVAYIGLLDMFLNFELKISMLLKLVLVVWTHYGKNECFATNLATQFLNYRGHLQLIIFIRCEC
jgi:hypothetical protein